MSDWRTAAELLALMGLPGVGPAKALAVARGETDLDSVDTGDLLPAILERERSHVARCEATGVSPIGYFDKEFPSRLRQIPQAPAVIYVRGTTAWPEQALAVVGTREPTEFGKTVTSQLTAAAAERGMAIVSGLALGIDAIAHEAALAGDAVTIAVLGSGLDDVSPRQHRDLANRILESGGSLISEQPFGTEAGPRTLVARNRLQSGLAQALLVGQAGVKGGTLHTTRFAAEQGRSVFCPVPPSMTAESAGLDVLLNVPAHKLPDVLPAWKGHRRLAERLGSAPLAHPVTSDAAASWLDELTSALASTPDKVGEQLTFDT